MEETQEFAQMANSSDWISSVAAGQQGHKVQRVQQAPRVLKVLKVPKVLRALRVHREPTAQRVLKAQLAKTEPTGPLIRQISIIRHTWLFC